MATARSPLAPERFPDLPPVAGVRLAATASGIKPGGALDLMLAVTEPDSTVAGSFTRSLCPSAAVDWDRTILGHGRISALVVNAGNANAFTGAGGLAAVEATVNAAADIVGGAPDHVHVASTGVIGEPLPVDRITAALPGLSARLDGGAWHDAAEAIRTTDTFAKGASATATIDGVAVTVCGIAKGSGMIAPDMATLLGFVFTDAAVAQDPLQAVLSQAVDRSFNAITVDGDTSTSDTALLIATGRAGHRPITERRDLRLKPLRRAVEAVMTDLAQQIARDGEGARKLITITVSGATSAAAARRIGLTVANSPLVKTAIAGEDANWGRIVMAVGRAGQRVDRDRLGIAIGGVTVARDGLRVPDYDEAPVAAHMRGDHVEIAIEIGLGRGRATVWTCDLTHGYIDINADYRT